jgi:hypothetical protein
MWFLKNNKKGQAMIEAVIVMNIMLLLFFAMILFSVYIYDKMIVMFAANIAIDEAIGKIPEVGMTNSKLETLMKQKAYGALDYSIFLKNKSVQAKVVKAADIGEISVIVSAKYSITMPFVSGFLNNNVITTKSKVDYAW